MNYLQTCSFSAQQDKVMRSLVGYCPTNDRITLSRKARIAGQEKQASNTSQTLMMSKEKSVKKYRCSQDRNALGALEAKFNVFEPWNINWSVRDNGVSCQKHACDTDSVL